MQECIPLFLQALAENNRSRRTIDGYRSKVGQFVTWLDGRTPTRQDLYAYRIFRQEQGKRPRTIRVDLTAIYAFFEWLEKDGWANPGSLPKRGCITLPRMDRALRESPTQAEVDRMFQAIHGMARHTLHRSFLRERARAIFTLLLYAGLRRAELLALDVRDIRMDFDPWRVHVRVGKGAQPRMVVIGTVAQERLTEYLRVRGEWATVHGHQSPALFPVDRRRRMGDHCLDGAWREVIAMAELADRHLTPHGCRHYFGTAIMAVEDLKTAQEMMGHQRVETTAAYLHTDLGKQARAAEAFGNPARSAETAPEPERKPKPPRQERKPKPPRTLRPRRPKKPQ
jgi:site-specific recombinase XerD